jgi:pimeloyl-ACP methyl ester carboxylesterase
MKQAAAVALIAVLSIAACGDPAPAPEVSTAKYADEWLVFAGSVPEDVYVGLNIHDTALGSAGRLVLKDGAAHPLRNIARTGTGLSFRVPSVNAAFSGTKSEGEWVGQWTDNDGERYVVFAPGEALDGAAKLVALPDGRRMHIVCTGEGAPAVVLDYGAGGTIRKDWGDIAGAIAAKAQTRVCLYDRAGRGLSDPASMPRDAVAVVADLDGMLTAANVAPPYVFVGHSLASYHVRLFANTHFDKTAGMVLVDPSGDGQLERFNAVTPKVQQMMDAASKAQADLNCIARLREAPVAPDDSFAKQCEGNDPDAIEATESEVASMAGASTEQLTESRRSYGDMPLVVLTAGDFEAGMPPDFTAEDRAAVRGVWEKMHDEMAALSSNGQHRFVAGAGHYIQSDQPQAVIDAVNEVVAKARNR